MRFPAAPASPVTALQELFDPLDASHDDGAAEAIAAPTPAPPAPARVVLPVPVDGAGPVPGTRLLRHVVPARNSAPLVDATHVVLASVPIVPDGKADGARATGPRPNGTAMLMASICAPSRLMDDPAVDPWPAYCAYTSTIAIPCRDIAANRDALSADVANAYATLLFPELESFLDVDDPDTARLLKRYNCDRVAFAAAAQCPVPRTVEMVLGTAANNGKILESPAMILRISLATAPMAVRFALMQHGWFYDAYATLPRRGSDSPPWCRAVCLDDFGVMWCLTMRNHSYAPRDRSRCGVNRSLPTVVRRPNQRPVLRLRQTAIPFAQFDEPIFLHANNRSAARAMARLLVANHSVAEAAEILAARRQARAEGYGRKRRRRCTSNGTVLRAVELVQAGAVAPPLPKRRAQPQQQPHV